MARSTAITSRPGHSPVRFATRKTDTDAMTRGRLVHAIKLGLVRFVAETAFVKQVNVSFPKHKEEPLEKPKPDPWNFWVFIISSNASGNGESNKNYLSLNNEFKINRVATASKFNFATYYNTNRNRYVVNGERISVTNVEFGVSAIYVRSFSEHWSAGGFTKGFHSIYHNIAFSQSVAPALEYSIFRVSEVTRRQFRWIYQAGLRRLNYIETTIYDKRSETLPFHQLNGVFNLTEPWGTLNAGVSGYQYLHDRSKNRLNVQMDVSWRIVEGLQLQLTGGASLINNQISLARATGDPEQILLNGRQLPTNFNYYSTMGLSYTFGSINNSVVNPRFSGTD